uniref:Uncharacterized protein n=1 Tax=Quercus lobata TaxID=97700 RepID=A0A7N2MX93_QUELO
MGIWDAFLNWLRSFGPKKREKGKFELVTTVPPLVAVGYVVDDCGVCNWLGLAKRLLLGSGTGQTLEIDSIETDIYAKRALTLVDTLGKGEAAMLEGSFGTCLFFKQEMELSLIGLQNAGKTSLVNVIAFDADVEISVSGTHCQTGGYSEDMIPTVGFNMKKVTKGNVTIKLWDLGGQPRFRSMWERYCRAVSAIVVPILEKEEGGL